jgi:TolB-like protein/DNA-binding winged helix-turn-helix (wHTH) protein/tetratricopeptide (TPR) repeat protein
MPGPSASNIVRFGGFTLDLRTGELLKNGTKIKLQLQPFQVLAMLLQHPGEMVTREELREKLWPEHTFVDFDDGLNTAVRKLRQVLGDSSEHPKYIETLPRRGYRFIGLLSNGSTPKAEPIPGVSERVIEEASSAANGEAVAEVPMISPVQRRRTFWAMAVALVFLVVLLAVLNAGRWREKLLARAAPARISSIAVLPLENLSGNPAEEYFADGITDALVTDLAQISSLRVISRTSVMRYKGTRKPLPEIAKELNVDGIVEGAVVRSGERLRVDAQLIQATTDRHLWASTYERNLGDVVALQSEVALAIARAIQVQLTPEEQAHLARAQSVDPQAYEFYVKGRFFCDKWTNASARKGIDYFQQAIQRDPNYALAYAGMADAYIVRTDLSPEERFSKAKALATVALQKDDGLAEAHTALAFSLFAYDWNWESAEKEFQRAIALDPNYAMAHQCYGQFQKAMGRQNWAAEVRRAHELDPLSLINAGVGQYIYRGQYDLALENVRKRLELDPQFAEAYFELGRVYERKGMYQDAIVQFQKAFDVSGGELKYLGTLGYAYGVSGNRVQATRTLKRLMQLSKNAYVSPYQIAVVYVGLGRKDLAFDWLQKALADRSYWLLFLRIDERMDTMRSDPRYAELLSRIGLPQ